MQLRIALEPHGLRKACNICYPPQKNKEGWHAVKEAWRAVSKEAWHAS